MSDLAEMSDTYVQKKLQKCSYMLHRELYKQEDEGNPGRKRRKIINQLPVAII